MWEATLLQRGNRKSYWFPIYHVHGVSFATGSSTVEWILHAPHEADPQNQWLRQRRPEGSNPCLLPRPEALQVSGGPAGPESARAEGRSPPGERMVIRVFISSSSGFVEIKKQQDVLRLLETTRERFEEVDIPMSEKQRRRIYNNIPWRRHLLRQPSATSDV